MGYAIFIVIILVFLTILVHLLALKTIYFSLTKNIFHPTIQIGLSVYILIVSHFIEVVIFAIGFYISVEYAEIGLLKGDFTGDFREYIYFSLVSYTSLGIGDVYPYGPIRLLTGIEALTGLLMIGWSASITYFCMHKVWFNKS